MAPIKNGRALFSEIPQGYPVVGKTVVYDDSEQIDLETVPLNGGFLVKTLVLSIDPYMRGRMREPTKASYSAAFALGKPLDNHGVGVVLRSETADIKVGDHVYGFFQFKQYNVIGNSKYVRVLENKEKLPWSVYVGTCGMPGKTAFYGWKALTEAKKGETAFVTTGAGPVGSLVIQLAKGAGLKVIASAGSEEKVAFMKSIGADVAFNYKTTSTKDVLAEHGPINVYWDHVGGETLEAALEAAAPHARFVECGMISQYNQAPYLPKNLMYLVSKSLTIRGFLVSTYEAQYADEFYGEIPARVASGEIKYVEDAKHGLDSVGQAIYDVQTGANKGKSVIIVAEE